MLSYLLLLLVFYCDQMLQMIAVSSRSLGPCSMFYLAAAVSDFYVPWKSMVTIHESILHTCSSFVLLRLHFMLGKGRSFRS